MSPASKHRRANGSSHIKSGPIPYRYIKKPTNSSKVLEVAEQDNKVLLNTDINAPGLQEILATRDPGKPVQPNYKPGPRDLCNQGKNRHLMVLPDAGGIHTNTGHVRKGKGGERSRPISQRMLPLYTVIPRSKIYAKSIRNGGPGGELPQEENPFVPFLMFKMKNPGEEYPPQPDVTPTEEVANA